MRFKGFISLGGLNDEKTEEFEIDDEELEGLNDAERANLIDGYLRDILYQYIDLWYEEL